jgi:enolase
MNGFGVARVRAMEILDSRGRPTVSVELRLEGGGRGTCAVPSGASTGSGEAVELRDGDLHRYGGMGVRRAVDTVNGEIVELLRSRSWAGLAEVDHALLELDGTANLSRLGANAALGVSVALARAVADSQGVELWRWLASEFGAGSAGASTAPRLPVPHFNVLNGGVHAANSLDFQEFMIAPLGASTVTEAVRAGAEVYGALRELLLARKLSVGLGDEGGFAPELAEPEQVLALLVEAIGNAGYSAGRDGVAIALDPAASELRQVNGRYRVAGELVSPAELVERYAALVADFPIWSIEDGMGEDDEEGWRLITERLGERVQLVGDDNFVTSPERIARGAEFGIANAVLIKPNQIGTMSGCLAAIEACRRVGYAQMVSHRSGETADDLIADLSVASGCGQLKSGAPARGERVAKYNRLLAIEQAHPDLPYGLP